MGALSPVAKQQFFDNNGNLAVGYKLYTYVTNTTTPLATYTDASLSSANANPIILDSRGEAVIYLQDAIYRYVLKDASDVTIWTRDNIANPLYQGALGGTSPIIVANISALSALTGMSNDAVATTLGYYTDNDGGHGTYRYDSSSSATVNGGTVISAAGGVGRWLLLYDGVIHIKQFGCKTDGTDCAAALSAAISDAITNKYSLYCIGHYTYNSAITVSGRVTFVGGTITSDESTSGRSPSTFIKNFDGVGFTMSGDDIEVNGVQFDSVTTKTGINVQVTGSRFKAPLIAVTNAGAEGLYIGKAESGAHTINANLFYIGRLVALANDSHGCYINNTNTTTDSSFPLGAPDCNGGYIAHAECDRNGGDGLRFGNCIDNAVGYVVAQSNTGYGVRFTAYARNNVITKSYTESNTAGDGIFDANSSQNFVLASRAVTLGSGWTNNGGNSNFITAHTQGVGQDTAFNTSPWHFGPEIIAVNASGAAYHSAYVGTSLEVSWKYENDTGSGTKATLRTKRNGDTIVDRLSIDSAGLMVLQNSTGFGVGKTANDTTNPGIFIGDTGSAAMTRINHVGSGSSSDTKHAYYNSNGQVGSITTSGTATAYNTSSDYRLKRDITNADTGEAITRLSAVKIREFEWISSGEKSIGVIAHELQEVEPQAVTFEKDGQNMQQVDLSKLIPDIILAVQYLLRSKS